MDRHAIFDTAWHLIAHVCQLQNAVDYVVADLAGLPVIAVCGADGVIRVFHNPLRENAVHHFHELLRRAYREAMA